MNFFASTFKRNIGPQPSVESIAVDSQNVITSNHNDRVNIRSGAFNRGGYAEATGLNNSHPVSYILQESAHGTSGSELSIKS